MNKNEIVKEVELKVAISEFYEEETRNMKRVRKSRYKVAMIASLAVVSITGVVFANDIGSFIKKLFGANTSDGVDIAINNGYVSEVQTETQSAEGIEIGVDSLIMDDFNFAVNFKVTLDDKYKIEEFKNCELEDLKIVDETGKMIFSSMGAQVEEPYEGAYSFLLQEQKGRTLTLSLSATGNPDLFPKSKHLSFAFTKVKTWYYDEKNHTTIDKFYEGDWNFEVDVPEEFYKRETTYYKATASNEDSININEIHAVLSNTALRITIPSIKPTEKIDYKLIHERSNNEINTSPLQREYIETAEGKSFEPSARSII